MVTDWYRSQAYYDSGAWRATWDGEGGGVLLNQCPHQLDLLQWLCGLPVRVRAACHEGKWHDIEVEDDVIVRRMGGRRTCKDCSQTFHVENNPPKVEGFCDFGGGELTIRKDDAPETVMARLETYHKETEPLKAFYEARGKLKSVENQPSIEATTAAITKALGI